MMTKKELAKRELAAHEADGRKCELFGYCAEEMSRDELLGLVGWLDAQLTGILTRRKT